MNRNVLQKIWHQAEMPVICFGLFLLLLAHLGALLCFIAMIWAEELGITHHRPMMLKVWGTALVLYFVVWLAS